MDISLVVAACSSITVAIVREIVFTWSTTAPWRPPESLDLTADALRRCRRLFRQLLHFLRHYRASLSHFSRPHRLHRRIERQQVHLLCHRSSPSKALVRSTYFLNSNEREFQFCRAVPVRVSRLDTLPAPLNSLQFLF